MTEKYYAYATGDRETHFEILYKDYGITSFRNIENVRRRAKEDVEFASKNKRKLEAIIIDITPLVQMGFIPIKKLRIMD